MLQDMLGDVAFALDAVHDLNEFIAGAAGGCGEPVEEPARLIRAGGDPQ